MHLVYQSYYNKHYTQGCTTALWCVIIASILRLVRTGQLMANEANEILRKEYVLELRAQGLPHTKIAELVHQRFGDGVAPGYCAQDVAKDILTQVEVVRKRSEQKAADLLTIEDERLNKILEICMGITMDEEMKTQDRIKSAEMVMRISERRAKLHGLDKPSEYQMKIRDWRYEAVQLLRDGKITLEQMRGELGDDLTRQVIDAGGAGILSLLPAGKPQEAVEGIFTEVAE